MAASFFTVNFGSAGGHRLPGCGHGFSIPVH